MRRSGNDSLGSLITEWVTRACWGRRLEAGLTLATVVARVGLAALLGRTMGHLVLAMLGVLLVMHQPIRAWILQRYRLEGVERVFAKVFWSIGLGIGTAPGVRAMRATPAGVVLDIQIKPRCPAPELEKLCESMAVALGMASVRVRRDPTAAHRAELVLVQRDPLAGAPESWPWAGVMGTDLWGGVPLGYITR